MMLMVFKKNSYQRIRYGFIILTFVLSYMQATSCKNKYEIYRNDLNDVYLSQENDSLLEGTYVVSSERKYRSIFSDFSGKVLEKYSDKPAMVQMKLQVRSETKIDLLFLVENELYRKRTLSGKFEGGYFKVKTKYGILKPLFPILWGPARYYKRLGITEKGKLVLIKEEYGRLIVVIVPTKQGCALSQKEYEAIPEL